MRALLAAGVFCALFAAAAGAAIEGPLFEASAQYKVWYEPISVAIADLNGDNINDMAVAHYSCDSISVLIGTGGGDYAAPVFYDIGTYQYDIEAVNIDDDTDVDIIVTTWGAVYTLDNDENGNFAAPVPIAGLANSPQEIELAITDGDGNYDLIVAHNDFLYTNLSVWDNDGLGNFTLNGEYNVGTYQRGLAVGDFDGNMSPDIAVATVAPDYSILLNDGSGSYTVENTYTLAASPRGMCAGTFDDGGNVDIAITRPGWLIIYTGDGLGGFSALDSTAISAYGYDLCSADLDGQNGPDLVMVDDIVEVCFNNGSGVFGTPVTYFVGVEAEGINVGKLDDDDYYDLAITANPDNYGDAPGHIAVLLNPLGNGQLMYSIQSSACPYTMSLCMADFDLDGYVDVATLDYQNDRVYILLGDGTGHFANAYDYAIGSTPYEVIAAELDGQNTEDLIIGYSDASINYISVLMSNGDGSFGGATNLTTGNLRPRGVVAADFDSQNGLDIASVNTDNTSPSITVFLNNGSGGFPTVNTWSTADNAGHSAIEAGDFDGLNGIDLVVPNYTNDCVEVFWNNGSGNFGAVPSANIADGLLYYPYSLCVDDLDNDGYADIIVGSYDSSEVAVIMSSGTGFDAPDFYYAGFEQLEIRVSDFNVDGNKDFVVLNTEGLNFSVFYGDGTGNFSEPKHYGTIGTDSEGLAVADFNDDGYPDVAVSNYDGGHISVMLNRYSFLTPVAEFAEGDKFPEHFHLSQNYPNPFNPSTTIQYSLPEKADVTVSIYNLMGQRVRVFHEGTQPAGVHELVWNGSNNSGQTVATGVYFYQIKAGELVDSRKMLLLK